MPTDAEKAIAAADVYARMITEADGVHSQVSYDRRVRLHQEAKAFLRNEMRPVLEKLIPYLKRTWPDWSTPPKAPDWLTTDPGQDYKDLKDAISSMETLR